MRFADPWVLVLCLLVPLLVYLVRKFDSKMHGSFRFSDGGLIGSLKPSFRARMAGRLIYLRAAALVLCILAASRPQSITEETKVYTEGVDIVLAVDSSSSMMAMDFEVGKKRVTRLDAVKYVVSDFIVKRPDDRIGMIAFASLAYTVCPLTLDHDWLERNLERVKIGMIEDGTAVGSAISAALNRLKDAAAKEKIIILLTDGRNNAGRISPLAAAEAAKVLGVRIYTIGAGTEGLAPFPVKDMFGNTVLRPVQIDIDERLLREIAQVTDGMYFRATDTQSLENIYAEIDKLEKTPIEESGFNIYRELFPFVLIPAFLLLLAEVVLSGTLLRRIP